MSALGEPGRHRREYSGECGGGRLAGVRCPRPRGGCVRGGQRTNRYVAAGGRRGDVRHRRGDADRLGVRGADRDEGVEAQTFVLARRGLDAREQGVLVGSDAGDEPVVGRIWLGVGLDADAAGHVVEPMHEGGAAEPGRGDCGGSARPQERTSADHHGRLADSRRSPEACRFGRVVPDTEAGAHNELITKEHRRTSHGRTTGSPRG
ncbi:hypothetical protein AERO9AM_10933 [Aeromicrobium sp. 9AM]|nr:hypothetical protein AERO9AM_10933 [Aeromicrobium sp. 9AM]